MVEIPEPYVRNYPLVAVKKEDLLELYYLFKAAPLPGLNLALNITARGSTHILDDMPGSKTEQELRDIIANKEKIITGFTIQASQRIDAPPPLISVSLRLAREEARLTIIKPRDVSRKDAFALDGLEEGIGKLLAKAPRSADKVLDSPYALMVAAAASGMLAYKMPYLNFDPVSAGLMAVLIIVGLWLANKLRAYKMGHVVFVADSDEDMFRQFNHTIRKYSREIVGGAITLSISLILLFITWFFHLA